MASNLGMFVAKITMGEAKKSLFPKTCGLCRSKGLEVYIICIMHFKEIIFLQKEGKVSMEI